MRRPSIEPEKLLRAFYSVRSERQLMESIEFDLLFRWFVGIGVDDPVWEHSSFSENRDPLLEGRNRRQVSGRGAGADEGQAVAVERAFLGRWHVDQAWAAIKSFKPKEPRETGGPKGDGRNKPADFRGEKRSNATHRSTTDPDVRLYRKGPGMEARVCFIGDGLMENGSRLIVDARLKRVSGHAERLAALTMIEPWADRPHADTSKNPIEPGFEVRCGSIAGMFGLIKGALGGFAGS
jgi:hypothetical protein